MPWRYAFIGRCGRGANASAAILRTICADIADPTRLNTVYAVFLPYAVTVIGDY
jgi:hypothetical protein